MAEAAAAWLKPLMFPEPHETTTGVSVTPIPCVLCACEFCGDDAHQQFLKHILEQHKMVISNVQQISNLKCYAQYWRLRLSQVTLTDVAVVIKTNSKPTDPAPSEHYYMLTEDLPEDKKLRQELHMKKLEEILQVQAMERSDVTRLHGCLFCPQQFVRQELFQHMLTAHSFNIGQPDNMVFVEEFLSSLRHRLDSLQCLYCNGVFKDRSTLRDHMRKKQHKKLNPKEKEYDKYYVINYLEIGKLWQEIQAEDDGQMLEAVSEEEDWSEWQDGHSTNIHCLFCTKHSHGFNFDEQCVTHQWQFYSQVKIINYLRRCVYLGVCPVCGLKTSPCDLLDHMTTSDHCGVPMDTTPWNEPHYLFPTYENDSLLNILNDKELMDS
ncbi:zinc finger protein 277-like isoform X3 [Dysidea avara]|uniref:zinc finger protein 277-like isoform X3 n=1 Tax=Dysidea avara TaxID=196820 RepID=UPI00332EA70A